MFLYRWIHQQHVCGYRLRGSEEKNAPAEKKENIRFTSTTSRPSTDVKCGVWQQRQVNDRSDKCCYLYNFYEYKTVQLILTDISSRTLLWRSIKQCVTEKFMFVGITFFFCLFNLKWCLCFFFCSLLAEDGEWLLVIRAD